MFSSKERKEKRIREGAGRVLDARTYNLIIGAVILYGFAVNAILIQFAGNFVMTINPIALIVGYFVSCLAGSLIVNFSKSPIISFLGYNLIVVPLGALLAICLPEYDPQHIFMAMLLTGVVTLIMTALAAAKPNFFAKLGPTLFFSLLIGIIVEIIATLFGYHGDIFNWFFVIIFSLYIGFDWNRAQRYVKTADNAVDSAVDLYLDIINLFLRILSLISKKD